MVQGSLTPEEFLQTAKEFRSAANSHCRLCVDYINQYWLKRDGRFANARVKLFGEDNAEGRHIIVSDMKNGWPPDENAT
jgi:hypothetical protein